MKKLLLSLCIAFIVLSVKSQSGKITFEIEAPTEVLKGETFRVSYVLNGSEGNNFKVNFENLKNANVLFGPSTSISSSSTTDPESGQRITNYSQAYIYTLKADVKDGTINLPVATIEVGTKRQTAKSVKINIVSSKTVPQNGDSGVGSSGNTPSENDDISSDRGEKILPKSNLEEQPKNELDEQSQSNKLQLSEKDVMIKTIVSRTAVGVGDTIEVTYRLYTKHDVAYAMDYVYPNFTGFYVRSLPLISSDFTTDNFDGQNYKVADIARYQLIAKDTGTYKVQPFSMTLLFDSETDKGIIAKMSRRERLNSMIQKTVSSEPFAITVGIIL